MSIKIVIENITIAIILDELSTPLTRNKSTSKKKLTKKQKRLAKARHTQPEVFEKSISNADIFQVEFSNRKAFLDMLAFAEGTASNGADGYNVVVGGTLFKDYSDHPRQKVWLPRYKINSTAAGRYQLLERYFDAYKKMLRLKDFSPASQDAIAIQQIKEQRALDDIDAGRFDLAVSKVRNIWASLPGAGYGQREQNLDELRAVYLQAGGTLSPDNDYIARSLPTPSFSASSKKKLEECHPDLQRLFNEVIKHVDCTVICGHRGEKEQNQAFAEGKSKLKYPNGKHNKIPALAVDVAPYYPGTKIRWNDSKGFIYFAGFVMGVASQMGIKIRSGADWNQNFDLLDETFIDLPHHELCDR